MFATATRVQASGEVHNERMEPTFVNSHTKGDGRHDNAFVGFHELYLDSSSLLRGQAGMVDGSIQLEGAQSVCYFLCMFLQSDIHDGRSRPFLQNADEATDLLIYRVEHLDIQHEDDRKLSAERE